MTEVKNIRVQGGDGRLDSYLTRALADISRSRIQKLLKAGLVTVNGRPEKASYRVKDGELITVFIPEAESSAIEPEPIAIDIIYSDEDLMVINKPAGLVVHPGAGNRSGTLVNALLFHCRDLSGIGGVERPGIVHRLDKDTSGLLVVAKNDFAHLSLAKQLKDRTLSRTYTALVHGEVKENEGRIDAPIGRDPRNRKRMAVVPTGRPAVTWYFVRERFDGFTLLTVRLGTGRTHQVRVHLSFVGYPIVGDPVYGPRKTAFDLKGQLLHASSISFQHPRTGEWVTFEAPLPERFEQVLSRLRRERSSDGGKQS